MADGYGTAGTVLKTAGPMLNAVPYIGPLLSMGASIGGGLLEQKAAKEQAAQADKMRRDALNLKPEKISKYYTDKLRADKMAALSGLPGYELGKKAIDANIATGLRAGAESSESGAQRLALASALIGIGNKSLNDLSMSDAEFKAGMQKDARATMQTLGDKEYQQQLIRDKWKEMGLKGAAAMENAATANSIGAMNKIMGSIASTATALGSTVGNGSSMKTTLDAESDTPTTVTQPELGATESTLNVPTTETPAVGISRREQSELVNKLMFEGKAKNVAEAYLILKQMGYKL